MSNHSYNESIVALALRIVYLAPGIHLRALQRLLGVSFTSTRYNVDKLCQSGAVITKKDGGYTRLYPIGTEEVEMKVYSRLRNETTKSILEALAESDEALTNKQLAEITHLAKSTMSEKLRGLVDMGLIKVVGVGRGYSLADGLNVAELISKAKNLHYSATDRFIDLWDF